MTGRVPSAIWILAGLLVVSFLGGCPPGGDYGPNVAIPNAQPDTYITGEHPSLLESGFMVHFYWTGNDPDGEIVGFQWRLSINGVDGISIHDTLTVDPATGDTLNPWLYTTGTDTTLIVTADMDSLPSDVALGLHPQDLRSWQSHTMFVRAVDEDGDVDPSPAQISFTATTLIPTVRVDRPLRLSNALDAQAAPPTVVFGYTGSDPDFELGVPTKVRFLFKPAWYKDHYVRTRYEYNRLVDELIVFSDSAWSEWESYPSTPEERIATFPNQPHHDLEERQIIYLFAIQVQDTAGAVSVDRRYGRSVHNVYISRNMTPLLVMNEPYLGNRTTTGTNSSTTIDIAQGQVLEFGWLASADDYAGVVEAYRYGWDLTDPNDEQDPNWAVQRGNSTQHRNSSARSFGSGTHTLTIQAWDNSNQMTRFVWILEVVPAPEPSVQEPALLVDDVYDQNSQAWIAADGITPLDHDSYRDAFWIDTLEGRGGVDGFNYFNHSYDAEEVTFTYRDIVTYRAVIWTTRYATHNFIWDFFKPLGPNERRFIWLASYQESVGNLFFIGSRTLNQFIEEKRWMIPWIFDTSELRYQDEISGIFDIGFGTRELPDGTRIIIGRERYPYRAMGVSMLDHTTPKYALFGFGHLGQQQRRASACVGMKGLVLDEAFKSRYLPEGDVFPDTIFTERTIDWQDEDFFYRDQLQPWVWGSDEIYNLNLSQRTTPWLEQFCDGERCVEPMFRIYSRFDWIDDLHEAAGDPDWPPWGGTNLEARCGEHALQLNQRTVTTGAPTAFFAHKLKENKPSRKADVVWGFDPYRFNHDEIQKAIQWVLGEHFGLVMKP